MLTEHSIAAALAVLLLEGVCPAQVSLDWIDRQTNPVPSISWGADCLIDASGNVYSVGGLGFTSSTPGDVHLVKYSPTGIVLWSRNYGLPGYNDYPGGLAFGAGGVILEFGASTISVPAWQSLGHIVAWDAQGNQLWSWVSSAASPVWAMAVGAQGELLCSGNDSSGNALIAGISAQGVPIWATPLGGSSSNSDYATDAAQDDLGNWYVSFKFDLPFGSSMSGGNAGIAKLDPAGQVLWTRQYFGPGGSAGGSGFTHVAVAPNGYSVASGFKKVGNGNYDMYVVAHDASGGLLWSDTPASTDALDEAWDVIIDSLGIAWVAGFQKVSFNDALSVFRYSQSGIRLSRANHVAPYPSPFPLDARLLLGSAGQTFVLCNMSTPHDMLLAELDSSGALTWSGLQPQVAHQELVALGAALSADGKIVIAATEGPNGAQSITTMQLDVNELPQSYCSPKLNSLGCLPKIVFEGHSSAAAGSGFTLKVSNVLANKSGLYFYGVNGKAATPFQGGTLCVQSPIRRTPAIHSAGSTACSGVYALDFNAFAQGLLGGTPLPALAIPGTAVCCQAWGRDSGFPAPNNTSLSGGLRYVVLP